METGYSSNFSTFNLLAGTQEGLIHLACGISATFCSLFKCYLKPATVGIEYMVLECVFYADGEIYIPAKTEQWDILAR